MGKISKKKLLHNHGSLHNFLLICMWEARVLLSRQLALADFKKLSKKLCLQFSSLV